MHNKDEVVPRKGYKDYVGANLADPEEVNQGGAYVYQQDAQRNR